MPFKPFAHLARVSFAKGITHSYAPSIVTAPSTFGQFQNHSAVKFSKASHVGQSFANSSGSSGAGAKAGYSTQASGGDTGLAQYYAAWQHAQQTGDDTDWKQHQFARRIEWKHSEKTTSRHQRLKSAQALELLRPARLAPTRTLSENAALDLKTTGEASTEVGARAQIDEAIAQEIKDIAASREVSTGEIVEEDVGTPLLSTRAASPAIERDSSQVSESTSSQWQSTPTDATSPVVDEGLQISDKIVQLGQQHRFPEIPALFESLIKDGHVPTINAYNYILLSAINLSTTYQPWPRALEVYGDMVRRSAELNSATYGILLNFLTVRSLQVQKVQKQLDQRAIRYGSQSQPFVFSSTAHQQQLYADDISLAFANKLYNIARATVQDFCLSAAVYNGLVRACADAGMVEQMSLLLSDMKAKEVRIDPKLYSTIINAYAVDNDLASAQKLYEQYRDVAIIRAANDPLDMQVYGALMKAYYDNDMAGTGRHFYEKVKQSFSGSTNEIALSEALTQSFIIDAHVKHDIDRQAFSKAISSISEEAVSPAIQEQALSKISVAAAEANNITAAKDAYAGITTTQVKGEAAIALIAMHLRANDITSARSIWEDARKLSIKLSTDFAAMFGLALIRNGAVETGVSESRAMFQRIRASTHTEAARDEVMAEIDEAVVLFGEELVKQQAVVSAQTSINLLRAMIENGGLISPVTENAIASLGPECIHQLGAQDIALALHVQAQMLPTEPAAGPDIAHSARFAHLLETVLNRNILMDPSTISIVSEATMKLANTRPDLLQRWQEYTRPAPKAIATPATPTTPHSTFTDHASLTDAFDPYAHTTDFRASKIISETLESTTGRIENLLSDALSRFRNVRRAGRHLHYNAYGKLLTAAGKAKQPHTISEIHGMAQVDVPFSHDIPAVRNGWISILDSMVAAYLTLGDRKLAAKFHQQLLDMGAAPSANTFGIYITTLEGTFDEATEAVKIFQRAVAEGVVPSVFLYNALIGKLGKARRIDDCLRYFGEMQNLGMRPSSVTYGTLVNALCRTSEESFAVEMFDEMEAAPNYKPRPAPYNSIIQYFLNTKRDRSKVLQYYERMKSRNIKPTSHTYKLLIEAHASLEPVDLASAEDVLVEMKTAGVEPEAVHYGTLIHAQGCVMHDMEAARATFDTVVSEGRIRITDNLYQNLLEAMVANHEVSKSTEVLSDMSRRGVSMTPYIANTLIHGWAGEGNITKAKSVFDGLGLHKREPSTYEAMTRAFLSVEDHAGANSVVQEMLRKGYPSAVSEKVLALVSGA